jgi:hypothetical protein
MQAIFRGTRRTVPLLIPEQAYHRYNLPSQPDLWFTLALLTVGTFVIGCIAFSGQQRNEMNIETATEKLDQEWDLVDNIGFFGYLKMGVFDPVGFERVREILNVVEIPRSESINRRFVEVTWFIPTFMRWQQEGWHMDGKDTMQLDEAIRFVEERLLIILGLP